MIIYKKNCRPTQSLCFRNDVCVAKITETKTESQSYFAKITKAKQNQEVTLGSSF